MQIDAMKKVWKQNMFWVQEGIYLQMYLHENVCVKKQCMQLKRLHKESKRNEFS